MGRARQVSNRPRATTFSGMARQQYSQTICHAASKSLLIAGLGGEKFVEGVTMSTPGKTPLSGIIIIMERLNRMGRGS